MQYRTQKILLKMMAAFLGALIVSSLACSIFGLTLGNDSATLEVTFTEDRLNQMFRNIRTLNNANPDNLLDKITSVELHEGYIRAFGEDTLPDGSLVKGSFDVSITAVDGKLKVELIAVDIPNVDMSDPRIVDLNTELAQDLSTMVTDTNGNVTFKDTRVSEELLTLTVQVGLK